MSIKHEVHVAPWFDSRPTGKPAGWIVYLNNMRLGTSFGRKADAVLFARNLRECLRNFKPRSAR